VHGSAIAVDPELATLALAAEANRAAYRVFDDKGKWSHHEITGWDIVYAANRRHLVCEQRTDEVSRTAHSVFDPNFHVVRVKRDIDPRAAPDGLRSRTFPVAGSSNRLLNSTQRPKSWWRSNGQKVPVPCGPSILRGMYGSAICEVR